MKIKILYEDKDILAIDKPAGISVHGDGRSGLISTHGDSPTRGGEKTIADWILKNYPKMKKVGENEVCQYKNIKTEIIKPGIVHRLDRDTSGVLLLAKNQKTFLLLKNQFINREIKKTYHAIVSGSVKNDRGIIDKPIGRSPKDFRRHLAGRGARGELREAITEYRVLKRFSASAGEKFTYLEIKPKTGRTHQIRVHLKFLNHPVVGDSLYNPSSFFPVGFSRLALHAKTIEFKNAKGKIIKIESPLPKEFKKLIN